MLGAVREEAVRPVSSYSLMAQRLIVGLPHGLMAICLFFGRLTGL